MITLYNIRPKGFNVGNDAIFMGLQHFIYETFGEIVNIISLPATSRYESQAKAGLTAKIIHEINQFGDGVIVGGGNIYENGELDLNIDALKALNVPLMVFSLSRGRIYDKYGNLVDRTDVMPDRYIMELNNKAHISLARDKATFEYLRALGCSKVQLGGCPTIFLDKMLYRLPSINQQISNTVFISLRNPSLMNIPLSRQAKIREDIIEIIDLLKSKNYEDIKFLCHDIRDIEFAVSFSNIEFVYTGDVYVYLNILRSCALNITYRLHSALPCISFGTPMIKISYDERACSAMDTIGFGEWNINMMMTQDIISDIKDRIENLHMLSKQKKETESLWSEQYSTMSNAFKIFASELKSNKEK
jgi:hypothetical protein